MSRGTSPPCSSAISAASRLIDFTAASFDLKDRVSLPYPEALKLVALKEIFGISIDNLLDPSFEVQMPPRTRKRRGTEVLEEMKAEQAQKAADAAQALPEEAPVATAKIEPAAENPHVEEAKVVQEAEKTPAPAPEAKEVKSEKKGFFSRLFGRK